MRSLKRYSLIYLMHLKCAAQIREKDLAKEMKGIGYKKIRIVRPKWEKARTLILNINDEIDQKLNSFL